MQSQDEEMTTIEMHDLSYTTQVLCLLLLKEEMKIVVSPKKLKSDLFYFENGQG